MDFLLIKKINDVRYYFILLTLFIMQGCVAIQSFPTVARAGDTITLAVGSADGMTKSNTTLTFTPTVDGEPVGASIDISSGIRSIIKLNPDETSALSLFQAGNVQVIENTAVHGAWLSVIILDLPDGTVLPVGEGVIDVDTTAAYSSVSPVVWPSIGIEILPGTGESNKFLYEYGGGKQAGNLRMFESLPQMVVRPVRAMEGLTGGFSAAEVKINIPIRVLFSGDPVPDSMIRIVHDKSTATRAKQVQMFWSREGDEITVNFLSPNNLMRLKHMRFSVVLYAVDPEVPNFEFLPSTEIVVDSFKVFDVDGVVTIGDPLAFDITIE